MRFAGNVHQFCHIFPQEKVYVQFDNTSYYTGETIWFKAFVVQACDNHRAPSGVLYVELLSPGGVILKQERMNISRRTSTVLGYSLPYEFYSPGLPHRVFRTCWIQNSDQTLGRQAMMSGAVIAV